MLHIIELGKNGPIETSPSQLNYKSKIQILSFMETTEMKELLLICGKDLKETLVNDLLNANYNSVLMDGSTYSSVLEQEQELFFS